MRRSPCSYFETNDCGRLAVRKEFGTAPLTFRIGREGGGGNMPIDWVNASAAILAVVVLWFLNELLRPKLIAWYVNSSAVPIETPQQTFTFHIHTFSILNQGRRAATNVRLGHHFLPQNFSIYPPVDYTTRPGRNVRDGEVILTNPLLPGQQLSITYLYYPPLTVAGVNRDVQSNEVMGRIVNVWTNIRYPMWVYRVLLLLLLLGLATAVYLVLALTRSWMGR